MPSKGTILVEVTPRHADSVAAWLADDRLDLRATSTGLGAWLVADPQVTTPSVNRRQRIATSLAKKFTKVARRRGRSVFAAVTVELSNEQAVWLAGLIRPKGGMFGSSAPRIGSLPPAVELLALNCRAGLRRRRGRPTLYGVALREAVTRTFLDVRRRKRLRRRCRDEDASHEAWELWRKSLNSATKIP